MIKKITNKVNAVVCKAKAAIECRKAEGYVDSGFMVLIAVVVGALFLTLLYALENTTIMPSVTTQITELFSYAG